MVIVFVWNWYQPQKADSLFFSLKMRGKDKQAFVSCTPFLWLHAFWGSSRTGRPQLFSKKLLKICPALIRAECWFPCQKLAWDSSTFFLCFSKWPIRPAFVSFFASSTLFGRRGQKCQSIPWLYHSHALNNEARLLLSASLCDVPCSCSPASATSHTWIRPRVLLCPYLIFSLNL